MQERVKPLELAFMGYNARLTDRFLQQFAEDNDEQVAQFDRTRRIIVLKDGTRIKGVSPAGVQLGFDSHRFDQLILADDEREQIYITAAREIKIVRASMALSCVPEEFQVLYYNVFSPPPCQKCGRPSEVIHNEAGTMNGLVAICRECHVRAHDAGGIATDDLSRAIIEGLSKGFAETGVGTDEIAEAFRRVAEAARATLDPETEIALIRANPNLPRFQKWRLVRKIKRRTQ